MNPLDKLKNEFKLNLKQQVKSREPVFANILGQQTDKPNIQIVDKRQEGYNASSFLNRIKQNQIVNVGQPVNPVISKAPSMEEIVPVKKTKVKKVKTNKKFIIGEDKEEQEQEQEQEDLNKVNNQELEEIEIEIPTKQKRKRTNKVEKGIVELGNETMVQIGDTVIASRLPKKKDAIDIKVSSYFMNNREIFIQFINGLFEPYKDNLLDESQDISCSNIGKDTQEVSLLTHQKIVRDYINLYTPYRGLLLFHGLGSGKTFSSIAIAEGFKTNTKIIVMTPASLRRNYLEEIKKYGDLIYRKNQYWEWISVVDNPETATVLSATLRLPLEYIRRKKGAWLVNVTKPNNYSELSTSDKKNLDDQLDEMIQNRYVFINYNGLRRDKFKQLTNNFEKNIFDNAVVIIDEAHNLISRIVNKINKLKKFKDTARGPNGTLPISLALQLYEFLLRANNCRIVLLSGTPIINYPNEIGILFNILRGYIKTWSFTLSVETTNKLTQESLQQIFAKEKVLDYMDYNVSSKILNVTRNPYGFENKIREPGGYKGVTNQLMDDRGNISDEDFVRRIVNILKKNDITAIQKGTQFTVNTALPDTLDEFINVFIDKNTGVVNNIEKFKRRIIGLTSYFRSAQEELLPRYNKITDFHVLRIPMSNYQFKIYEEARTEERKMEKPKKQNTQQMDKDGIFVEPTSTYRIFSRLFCNFVMPRPPGRPKPRQKTVEQDANKAEEEDMEKEKEMPEKKKRGRPKKTLLGGAEGEDEKEEQEQEEKEREREEPEEEEEREEEYQDQDQEEQKEDMNLDKKDLREKEELEGDELLEMMGDDSYRRAIKDALLFLKAHSSEYLSPHGLETYSPKFLAMLENIQDPEHLGLHLIYSQFRSMEGIAIFCLVLEANGFAQFKLKKNSQEGWAIDMDDNDIGKPTFALYTGTEDAEEREIIRNIYNGAWNYIPSNIAKQLKKMSNNNNMGEIIKILMITAAGSEGINLRNTRYVHLMEPYWHPVRLEQLIGRARRICSHQDLPSELQTVEVFLYLMTFTADQLASDEAIELKLKDLSKREPFIPLTSDEKLFEISSIKEELTSQLLMGIKETSIDCAIHVKSSSKENLQCLSFGQVSPYAFSYNPNYTQDENDKVAVLNKTALTWRGRELTFNGKKMILREETRGIYDYDSYKYALEHPGHVPILLGQLEKKDGKYRIVKV